LRFDIVLPLSTHVSKPRALTNTGSDDEPWRWRIPRGSDECPTFDQAQRVGVGIIDTGINGQHAGFAARTSAVEFAEVRASGDVAAFGVCRDASSNAHGTRVALILGGKDGVAPNCRLRVVLAMPNYMTDAKRIAAAIDWLVANQEVNVINMSLGVPHRDDVERERSVLRPVIRTASLVPDLWLVAASGNAGAGNVTSPGAYEEVIAVGATDQKNDFWYGSGHGTTSAQRARFNPQYVAAGGCPLALASDLDSDIGTSFAAPVISGLIANAMALGYRNQAVLDYIQHRADRISIGNGRNVGSAWRIVRL
jgi:subtilisin family serine protease